MSWCVGGFQIVVSKIIILSIKALLSLLITYMYVD